MHDETRIDTMYDLGEEIDEFTHDIDSFTLQGGVSRGLVDKRVNRWLMGVTSEEHTFRPTAAVPAPLLLPPDRKLVYPWIGWQLIEEDFREMIELNTVGRTEDISLGLNVFASIGFAKQRFDADRDAELLRFGIAKGWDPAARGGCCSWRSGDPRDTRTRAIAIPRCLSPLATTAAISIGICSWRR